MDCKLCGLPTPTPPIEDNGTAFCCIGCREVFRHFGPNILVEHAQAKAEVNPSDRPVTSPGAEAFLRIAGMHCSSCEILIEKTAQKTVGIFSAASSFATSTAKITYDPTIISESRLPEVFSMAGFSARLRADDAEPDDERQSLLRLLVGVTLAISVMMLYLAFYYPTHLGLVGPAELEPVRWLSYRAVPIVLFLLTTVLIFYVGAPIFRGALIGLHTAVLSMDNLLAIAILAAYGYSVAQVYAGSIELYFDVSAAIVLVVTVGRYLERGARADATNELTKILQSWAPVAWVRIKDRFEERAADALEPGDRVVVWHGQPIPIDGVIVEGRAAVDESLMTGEPFPVQRGPGQSVVGGAVVVEGSIEIEVGPAAESQLNTLARILWTVQSTTAGAHNIADRVARLFVPAVLGLAVLVSGVMLAAGYPLTSALLTGLATLIVSCPCTFGLAIPMATAAAVSTALRNNIIVSSADVFEKAAQIDIVVIDKTGTLSTGEMTVVEVIGPQSVAPYAAAVERLSNHPIAKAIASLDGSLEATEHVNHPGRGAVAKVNGDQVAVGSGTLISTLGWVIPAEFIDAAEVDSASSAAVSFVGWNGHVRGVIITRDRPRPGWQKVIDVLNKNFRVVLLTGAEHLSGYEDRVAECYSGIPAEAKATIVRRLKSEGTVVMIGDGSNDAPALAAADLGIAFGAPTALAADAADLVVLGNRLDRIFDAFAILGTTRRRIRQNLGWALLYNAIAIPLAMTGYLNPLFAALAMSASSLLVVWNSSRPIAGIEAVKPDIMPDRDRMPSRQGFNPAGQ